MDSNDNIIKNDDDDDDNPILWFNIGPRVLDSILESRHLGSPAGTSYANYSLA